MTAERRRAVILHGKPDQDEYFSDEYPSGSNSHWIPWLQKQLQRRDYDAQTPEVFGSWKPDYPTWRAEFERNIVDGPMTLVGHSCGGGFLLRWLSENPGVRVERLALVAPWLDPGRTGTTDFFDFEMDAQLDDRVGQIHLFHSRDDMDSIVQSVATIMDTIDGIELHEYPDMGHFCLSDMKTDAFPDLLDALVN